MSMRPWTWVRVCRTCSWACGLRLSAFYCLYLCGWHEPPPLVDRLRPNAALPPSRSSSAHGQLIIHAARNPVTGPCARWEFCMSGLWSNNPLHDPGAAYVECSTAAISKRDAPTLDTHFIFTDSCGPMRIMLSPLKRLEHGLEAHYEVRMLMLACKSLSLCQIFT